MKKLDTRSKADIALLDAVAAKDISALTRALNDGANPDILSSKGLTPLMTLLFEPFTPTIRKLCIQLLAKKANPNLGTANGVTPLHLTCKIGDEMLARMLFASEANVNAVRRDTGETPLNCALKSQNKKLVEDLRGQGATRAKSKPFDESKGKQPKIKITHIREKEEKYQYKYYDDAQVKAGILYVHYQIKPGAANAANKIKEIWKAIKAKADKKPLFKMTINSIEHNGLFVKCAALMERLMLNLDAKGVQELDELLGKQSFVLWNHFVSKVFFEAIFKTGEEQPQFTPKKPRDKKGNQAAYGIIYRLAQERWDEAHTNTKERSFN